MTDELIRNYEALKQLRRVVVAARPAEQDDPATVEAIASEARKRLESGEYVDVPAAWPGLTWDRTRKVARLLRKWAHTQPGAGLVVDRFESQVYSGSANGETPREPAPFVNDFAPLGSHDDCDEIRDLKAELRRTVNQVDDFKDRNHRLASEVIGLRKVVESLKAEASMMRPDTIKINARVEDGLSAIGADAATDDDGGFR